MNPTDKDHRTASAQRPALWSYWRWGLDIAIVIWLVCAWVIPEWTPGVDADAGVFGDYVQRWKVVAQESPGWMFAAFVLAIALGGVLGVPPPNVVGLAWAAIYGFWPALIASWPGVVVGGVVGVMLVRRYLRPSVLARWPAETAMMAASAAKSPVGLVLSLRITPIIPALLANLFIGVTNVRLWTYGWASLVGRLPLTYLYCAAGASISHSIEAGVLIDRQAATILALAALLPHGVVAVKTALVGRRRSAVQATP